MAKSSWAKFPYPEKAYEYEGAALKKAWPRLHRGDCEPFPGDAAVQDLVHGAASLACKSYNSYS